MIGLLSLGLRVVLLAVFTFVFVVLFEHGTQGFAAGVPVEWAAFRSFLTSLGEKKSEPPAPVPAPVTATPPPAPVAPPVPEAQPPSPPAAKGPPSAWEQLQSRPIGGGLDSPVATPISLNGN